MKFLHLGDLHLGRSLGDFDLFEDQKFILDQIISIVKEESVEAVLIAGDVYDKSIPSERATKLLDYFLSSLSKLSISIFMISGNHDSDDRLNFGSSLFESNNIFISSVFDGKLYKRTIHDEHGELNVYLLPFVKASQVRHFYPDEKIENYDDAVRAIINNSDIDDTKRNIIVAHQFVTGKGADPIKSGSEGLSVIAVGLVEKIGYDCFNKFDYVALGHIHSPQKVGREEIRYSGSPLKYSLSEASSDKSVPIITMGEKGNIDVNLVLLKPLRDLRHITGTLEKLLDKDNVQDTEDYIYVTLKNESFIDNAMGIFQQVYPRTIKIDYSNSHTNEASLIDIANIAESKTFTEFVSDFYRLIYNCDIGEEELTLMKTVAKEAGIDETD